jgi:hypothetical protein
MTITNFHHWGLAEWLDERSKSNPNEELVANIHFDECEDVYYLDICEGSGQCLDTFNYMREEEILDDLTEANKQFELKIEMI